MTIQELLDELDGSGIVITNQELVEETIHKLGLAPFDEVNP